MNFGQTSKEKEVFLQEYKHWSATRDRCKNIPESAKIKLSNGTIL